MGDRWTSVLLRQVAALRALGHNQHDALALAAAALPAGDGRREATRALHHLEAGRPGAETDGPAVRLLASGDVLPEALLLLARAEDAEDAAGEALRSFRFQAALTLAAIPGLGALTLMIPWLTSPWVAPEPDVEAWSPLLPVGPILALGLSGLAAVGLLVGRRAPGTVAPGVQTLRRVGRLLAGAALAEASPAVDLSPDDAAWFGEVRSRRVERAAILVLADEWIGDAEASLARWRRWIPLLAGLAGFSLLTGLAGFSLTTGLARVLGVGWTALAGLVLGT